MKIAIRPNVHIEVEDSAPNDVEKPVILLLPGLAMQLTQWPILWLSRWQEDGWRIIRLDHRDSGLSSRSPSGQEKKIIWDVMLHGCDLPLNLPYTLADLADDAMRVLDHFKIKKAHIVGFSMGGMVAQHMAFTWPTRILSLLIISSSSGDPNLPKSAAKVWRPFFRWPNNTSIEAIFEHAMHLNSLLNSDIEKMPSTELVQLIYMNLQRSMPNNGDIARQQLAILADVTRHEKLSSIICPTLIIQGDQDPLFTSEHGFDLAMRIPKAVFINIPAMGHNLASDEENALYVIFIAHLNKAHNSMI